MSQYQDPYTPQQGQYRPQEQYSQYPPQQGQYPPQGGYPPQGQYPPQGGYPPQGQYPPQGGYPPQGQYPPQGAYAVPPQGQYGMPMAQSAMNYAGVGVRFVATLIDGVILGVVGGIFGGIIGGIIGAAANAAANAGQDPNAAVAGVSGLLVLLYLVLAVIVFGYYIVMEAKMGGTIGKKAMGLRIVREDGSPISWKEAILRTLLRIVDGLFYYLVGAIIIWNSPLKQRLGDKVAHTVVIKTR
jgi:uncharacterized RDD family membrane protein YckC